MAVINSPTQTAVDNSVASTRINTGEFAEKGKEFNTLFRPNFTDTEGAGQHKWGQDYIGQIAKEHLGAMRERYPMLTSLLLQGTPQTNANLSSIENTNKYARLADAYNAGYLYQYDPISGSPTTGVTSTGTVRYVPVNKIETQDQKQMDQLRQAQADLRVHQLGQEQFFTQDYFKRKADEAKILVDQGYAEQFWNSSETMRQTKALFDQWMGQTEYEFQQTMNQLGIPYQKAEDLWKALHSQDYGKALIAMNAMNLDGIDVPSLMLQSAAGPILDSMGMNPSRAQVQAAQHQFQSISFDAQLEIVNGALDSLKAQVNNPNADPRIKQLVPIIDNAIGQVESIVGSYTSNLKGTVDTAVVLGSIWAIITAATQAVKTFKPK